MILTGEKIKEEVLNGNIYINPFSTNSINPNSYNLKLADDLYVYEEEVLDMKQEPTLKKLEFNEKGIVLQPNKLYLARTLERTFTKKYVPMIEGRSSIGRLGIFIHVTAGFGDIGFNGYWTLELGVLQPIRIYPWAELCQIYYHIPEGEITLYGDNGKYNNNNGVQGSKIYKEF